MNRVVTVVVILTGVLGIAAKTQAQMSVNDNYTAQQLAARLAGPGVVILNPVLTYPQQANAVFYATNTNLGIDTGILLTSGRSVTNGNAIGVNGGAYNLASTRNNAPGDPQLDPLAGQATHDACALEFDVIPQGDSVRFDYVFGSEEYINATCGPYNDAFAFFINGPGISGMRNMALVPNTNIPVTINSINRGVPGPGYTLANCTAMGAGSPFVNYFINNASGTHLTYHGFTTILQAVNAVIPCSTYHLKMVIADGGNFLYDSGVFIRSGSLQANTYRVQPRSGNGATGTGAMAIKACAPGTFTIKTRQAKSVPQTIRYILGGNAVNGIDYAFIADSTIIPANQTEVDVIIQGLATAAIGPKTVMLKVISPNNCTGAFIADSAALVLLDTISFKLLTPDTAVCKGDQVALRVAGDTSLAYRWLPPTGIDHPAKQYAIATINSPVTYVVQASMPAYGCLAKSDTVHISMRPVPEISIARNQRVCLHDTIKLGAVVMPGYANYTFEWTGPAGFKSDLSNPVIVDGAKNQEGTYYLTLGLDTNNCTATASTNIVVDITEPPVTAPFVVCQGKSADALQVSGADILWYESATSGGPMNGSPVPNTDQAGVRNYYVTQTIFGCESERAMLSVDVKMCCDRPVFLPTAFTPNNDGKNDRFAPVYTGFGYTTKRLRIYNRWGQLMFQSFDDHSWDGTWNGGEAKADTYFYELLVRCEKGSEQQLKGDVLLVR